MEGLDFKDDEIKVKIVGPICTSKKEKPSVDTAVEELKELGEYLSLNSDLPTKDRKFKRGTVCTDGRLDLCKQNVGPQGAEYLRGQLKGNTKIKHLLMGDDSLGSEGAKSVAGIIRESTVLETVYLGCNYFEEEGSEYLSEALVANENVKSLWIKRNHLGMGGAKKIADMMSLNTHIETLDLITNQLGPESVYLLKEALLKNEKSCLKSLMLDSNPIGVEGARHLADLLRGLKTLELLSLENTSIGDEGCKIIAETLADESAGLHILDLRSNGLKHQSAIALSEMLKKNKSLKELSLGHSFNTSVVGGVANQMGDAGIVVMATALKHNTTIQMIDMTQNNNTNECYNILYRHLLNSQAYIRVDLKDMTTKQKQNLLILKSQRKGNLKIVEKIEFEKSFISPIISVYRQPKDEKKKKSKEGDNLSNLNNLKQIVTPDNPSQNLSFTFNSLRKSKTLEKE